MQHVALPSLLILLKEERDNVVNTEGSNSNLLLPFVLIPKKLLISSLTVFCKSFTVYCIMHTSL